MIEAIKTRAPHRVESTNDALEIARQVATELVHERQVRPSTMQLAFQALGKRAVVELVMNVGFYELVSATLTAFPTPEPEAELEQRETPK
jgi:hypothetical protein